LRLLAILITLEKKEANIKLSQVRADAVAKILIEKFGVAKERITSKGYGPDKPIALNTT
jgi:OOP family OmpA-OmpF porin